MMDFTTRLNDIRKGTMCEDKKMNIFSNSFITRFEPISQRTKPHSEPKIKLTRLATVDMPPREN